MARLRVDLELDQVRAIVREFDHTLDPVAFAPLHGGVSDVYRIDLADAADPLVLKIYNDEPTWIVAKEALVAGWIGDRAGLPIPRWLWVDEGRTRIPCRFALTTWLPGMTVRSLIGAPGIDEAYLQMGALLRRLHSMPMSAYGYIVANGIQRPQRTNEDYMRSAFSRAFQGPRASCEGPAYPVALHATYKWFPNELRTLPTAIDKAGDYRRERKQQEEARADEPELARAEIQLLHYRDCGKPDHRLVNEVD